MALQRLLVTQDSQGLGVFWETGRWEPGGKRPGSRVCLPQDSSEPACPAQTLQTSGWARAGARPAPQAAGGEAWARENRRLGRAWGTEQRRVIWLQPQAHLLPPTSFLPLPRPQALSGSSWQHYFLPPQVGLPSKKNPPIPFLVWHQPTLPASSVPEISPRASPGPLPAPAPLPQAPTVKTLIARASTSSDPPCAGHCP